MLRFEPSPVSGKIIRVYRDDDQVGRIVRDKFESTGFCAKWSADDLQQILAELEREAGK